MTHKMKQEARHRQLGIIFHGKNIPRELCSGSPVEGLFGRIIWVLIFHREMLVKMIRGIVRGGCLNPMQDTSLYLQRLQYWPPSLTHTQTDSFRPVTYCELSQLSWKTKAQNVCMTRLMTFSCQTIIFTSTTETLLNYFARKWTQLDSLESSVT